MYHRCTSFHRISENFMTWHVALFCRVLSFGYDMASVSRSFSLSKIVCDLDRLQVVLRTYNIQETIRGIAECIGVKLRLSIFLQRTWTCSSCNFAKRPRISSGGIATLHVHGVVLSSSFDNLNRFCKDVGSFLIFIFIFVFLRMCPALSASAVDGLFRMLQANKTLSCSDCFAKFVQFDIVQFFELAHWIRFLVSSLRWWICPDFRLAVYQPKFASLSPVLRPCGCRLVSSYDSPRTRRSIWNELSSFVALFRIGASDCLANSFSLLFWNNLLLLLMPSSSRQYVP